MATQTARKIITGVRKIPYLEDDQQPPAVLTGGPGLISTGVRYPGLVSDGNVLFPYSSPAPTTAGLPEAVATARGVNAANLDYLDMGIPGYGDLSGQMSGQIGRLLDPNDPLANYDVASQAAEDASMMGIVGSPLASSRANQRRQLDVERRALLADRLLSGAAGRLPQPYDISRDLITPYQREQIRQQQEELDFRRLSEQERIRLHGEELELRRLGLNRASQPRGGTGSGGGGGGTPAAKPAGTPSTQSTGRSIQNLLDTYVDKGAGWGRTWSTEAQPTGGANLGSATPDFGLTDMDFTLGGLFDFPGSPYDTSYGGLIPPTEIMDMALPYPLYDIPMSNDPSNYFETYEDYLAY